MPQQALFPWNIYVVLKNFPGLPVPSLVLPTARRPGAALLVPALILAHEAWLAAVLPPTPTVSRALNALKRKHLALLLLIKNVGLTALTRARDAASSGPLTVLPYGLSGSPDPVMLTVNGLRLVVLEVPLPIGMQQQN